MHKYKDTFKFLIFMREQLAVTGNDIQFTKEGFCV